MAKEILIYSTPTCHFCTMTKDFLKEKGIVYTDINVSEDAAKRQEMIEKSGQMGVPVIVVKDGEHEDVVVGFDEERLSKLLGV